MILEERFSFILEDKEDSEWERLKECLLTFLPCMLPDNIKPKEYDRIRKQYIDEAVWNKQADLVNCMKDIEIVVLLACNDLAFDRLSVCCSALYKSLDKLLKAWKKYQNTAGLPVDTTKLKDYYVSCREYDLQFIKEKCDG